MKSAFSIAVRRKQNTQRSRWYFNGLPLNGKNAHFTTRVPLGMRFALLMKTGSIYLLLSVV